MATAYYKDSGERLKGTELKKYLKALAQAEKTGKPYSGKTYYTQEALESKYGTSLGIIRKLGDMRGMLSEAPALYKQRSDADLATAADAQYAADAASAKNIAQTQYNSNLLALEQQKAALDAPYQAQVAQAQKQTAQNVDTLSGSMLSRGLGRSSYAGALQQTTQQAGANAVNAINAEKTAKVNDIGAQQQGLSTNLSGTLATIDANKDSSVRSAIDQMRNDDYTKTLNSATARNDYILALLDRKKKVSKPSTSTKRSTPKASNNTSNNSNSGGNWLTDLINSFF